MYDAFYVTDHTTHFYALSGPDVILGPDAPVAERNILGVIHKVGRELGGRVIDTRRGGHRVIEIIGGRRVHPCTAVPGGMTKSLSEAERAEISDIATQMLDFAGLSLEIFDNIVTGDAATRDLVLSDLFRHETYYSGLVDDDGKVALLDGRVNVVCPDGERLGSYAPAEYQDWIAEHVEPWTYLKFPYLKQIGWKGFVDGKDSGVYCVGPLGRLNAASGMATPRAQEHYERYFATLSSMVAGRRQPVHLRGASHWARLIEMLYAAERIDPARERSGHHLTRRPCGYDTDTKRGCGHGRGASRHAHTPLLDRRARHRHKVNLIVGTTNNHAPIAMSIDRAARGLIRAGVVVDNGLLDRIEMAFRADDPCFGCATHSLLGQMPLQVTIRNADGVEVKMFFGATDEHTPAHSRHRPGRPDFLGDDGVGWRVVDGVCTAYSGVPRTRGAN